MPRWTMETEHQLGREEAIRRLKEKFVETRRQYGEDVDELEERWEDHTFRFGFRALGMKVAGTITVDEDRVRLDTELPMAAMLVRGMIEQRVREQLGDLLA